MRIVKHGNNARVIICETCNCEYEYETTDIIEQVGGSQVVKCPECGSVVHVSSSIVSQKT